jgi:ribosomal protein S18 acetylase RimI-like enzyme
VIIRTAYPGESDALSSLAFASKAYWGYSAEQLEAWSDMLRVAPESVANEPTYVAESDGRIVGVVQLGTASTPWQIDCLWVHPERTRRGIGTRLIEQAAAYATAHGQSELLVGADPNAEAFYLRLGARRVGELAAAIAGDARRVRPQLVLSITSVV